MYAIFSRLEREEVTRFLILRVVQNSFRAFFSPSLYYSLVVFSYVVVIVFIVFTERF